MFWGEEGGGTNNQTVPQHTSVPSIQNKNAIGTIIKTDWIISIALFILIKLVNMKD